MEDWNISSYFWFVFVIMCVLAVIGGCFCGLAQNSNFNDSMFLVGFVLLMIMAAIFIGMVMFKIYEFCRIRRIRIQNEQVDRLRLEQRRASEKIFGVNSVVTL